MFDLFVLQNTAQRRVKAQFDPKPEPRRQAQSQEAQVPRPRRKAVLVALRPFRAAADR